MVDPSKCPIPPGFKVIGFVNAPSKFSDDFEDFKDTTTYKSWKHKDGREFGGNIGVSKRWKNSKVTWKGMVCGFQFRIGRNVGERWVDIPETNPPERIVFGKVNGGDVNVHFPRRDGPGGDRGGYIVSLKWFTEGFTNDGTLTEASLDKEIPHDNYGEENYFQLFQFRGHTNPNKIRLKNIRDGQWHSFLAVIYNDWHHKIDLPSRAVLGTSELFPTMGLWYSDKATTNFSDFRLVGMGIDLGDMKPRGPLKERIGRDQQSVFDPHPDIDDLLDPNVHTIDDILVPPLDETIELIADWWFGENDILGDEIFVTEHALQIRIDDVPLNELEIQNVYAANVEYVGIGVPQSGCVTEAKAISDIRAKIEELKEQAKEARNRMIKPGVGFGSPEFNTQREILNDLFTRTIPNAISELRTAEFNYLCCAEKFLDLIDHPANEAFSCEPFEKKRNAAHAAVKNLEEEVRTKSLQMSNTHSDVIKEKLSNEIDDIENNKLPPAREKLAAAQKALNDCLHPSVHI